MERGEKFWCWWMSRYLWFRRTFVNRYTGVTYYVFEDAGDAQFDLTESQVARLERMTQK